MPRQSWKLPYISPLYFKKKFTRGDNYIIPTRCRNSIIPAVFADLKVKVYIYNGTWFASRLIQSNMVGLKFGEFSLTKRSDKQTHLKKKSKKKPKGKK